jgi:hypothetical protein
LKDNSKRSLTDDEHTRIEASIIHALQAPPKLFGAHEQVIGGAWGIAKEHPIQCVALALLIVGVFFLLYFWLLLRASRGWSRSSAKKERARRPKLP